MSESEDELSEEVSLSPAVVDLTSEKAVGKGKNRATSCNASTKRERNSDTALGQLTRKEVQKGLRDGVYEHMPVSDIRSDIWESFSRVAVAGTAEKLDFAGCLNCDLVYRFTRTTGTTALREHADRYKTKTNKQEEGPMDKYVKVDVPKELKQIISNALAQYSAVDSRSFRECEGRGFQAYADAVLEVQRRHRAVLNAEDILPSVTTVRQYVLLLADSLRRSMNSRLKLIILGQGGCVTLDGWTEDHTKTKFIGCTFHYVENYILKEELLFISDLDSEISQSGIEIRDFVSLKLSELSITEEDAKNVTFVTDSAANMIKVFNLPGLTKIDRIGCACHMLNTCCQKFVNQNKKSPFLLSTEAEPVLKLFKTAKSLISYLKQTYLYRRLSVAPVQACETRWNSNIDMFDSIIRLYPELETILRERDALDKLPSPLEFLQAAANILRPLKEATKALEGSQSPTIHLVASYFFAVKEHFSADIPVEHHNIPQFAALKAFQIQAKKVTKAKLVFADVHKIAVFLNPAMKQLVMFDSSERSNIHTIVKQRMNSLPVLPAVSAGRNLAPAKNTKTSADFSKYSTFADSLNSGSSVLERDEIATYLLLPPPPSTKSVLEVWKD